MKLFVRYGDEYHEPDEFIRPNDVMVKDFYEMITEGIVCADEKAMACWEFVVTEVDYPRTATGGETDFHLMRAYPYGQSLFGVRYRVNLSNEEFFEYPSEVLGHRDAKGRMCADCDGTSSLLTSLIRNALPAENVKMMIGSSHGNEKEADHAWVEALIRDEWLIMETTLRSLPADVVVKAGSIASAIAGNGNRQYLPFVEFNDVGYNERIHLDLPRIDRPERFITIAGLWNWPLKV